MRNAMLLALAVAVAACGTDQEETIDGTEAATETTAESPTPGLNEATAVAIQTAQRPDGSEYLTDGDGRALYLLEGKDQPTACVDACATEWPPFTAETGATPSVTGAQQDLVGTVQRPDGTSQITYGGHPLYYYAEDTAPGDVKGQDYTDQWGEWYLVAPTGEQVH